MGIVENAAEVAGAKFYKIGKPANTYNFHEGFKQGVQWTIEHFSNGGKEIKFDDIDPAPILCGEYWLTSGQDNSLKCKCLNKDKPCV